MNTPFRIPISPYEPIQNLRIDSAILDLDDVNFRPEIYQEGVSVISFVNCRIINFEIRNKKNINYPEVSIFFKNCLLAKVKVEEIESENVHLSFHGSIINGHIKSSKLVGVDINNCFSHRFLFENVALVRVTYTQENFENDYWQELFLAHGFGNSVADAEKLVAAPIKYQIINPTNFWCTSNFLDEGRHLFKTEISLSFSTDEINTDILISSVTVPSFTISGTPKGNIALENVQINEWYIYHFYPKGRVTFHDIRPIPENKKEAKIGIHKAVLDQVEFDNISFDSYPIISFFRTKFSNAIFTSCDFPNSYTAFSKFVAIENVHYPEQKKINHEKAQYEIFLSLRKALDSTGNYYESQKIQAISYEVLRRVKGLSSQDKLILFVNNCSNKHGLSIRNPFLGFLVFSILIYTCYLFTLGRVFNANEIDWKLFGMFFAFVDITHRSDFLVTKDELTGWSYFVDYMGKIIVGFFIYQFVASFRKYGKK